jgi:nitrite reductase/ring-hydroxylating ferredoxin subunit
MRAASQHSNADVNKLVDVARVDDIPAAGGLTVHVDTFTIALFKVDRRVYAIDGACIRCASLLASGTLEAHEVACARCGWRYDVTTGRLPAIPKLRVDTFEVEVIGTRVVVRNPLA